MCTPSTRHYHGRSSLWVSPLTQVSSFSFSFISSFFFISLKNQLVNGHRKLLPARLRSLLPAEGELTIVSHYANAVGILLALPAAVTGLLEYLGLVQGRAGQRLKQGAKAFDANKSVEANKNHAKELAGARESKILGLATAHGLVNAAVCMFFSLSLLIGYVKG